MIKEDYNVFELAYDYFNKKFFDNNLPQVIFTLECKARSLGHFGFERFESRNDSKKRVSVLSLNPEGFVGRTDLEILSTLLHEMVHVWEAYLVEPVRDGYHTKVWGGMMEEVGLTPSSNGEQGGKKTGQKMSHYITDGGPFVDVAGAFLTEHKVEWESRLAEAKEKKDKKKATRKKYTCPNCDANAWAKNEISLICGKCGVPMPEEIEETDEN
jgi:ribosomal protein S27AE